MYSVNQQKAIFTHRKKRKEKEEARKRKATFVEDMPFLEVEAVFYG